MRDQRGASRTEYAADTYIGRSDYGEGEIVNVRVWKEMDELPSPFSDRLLIDPNEAEVAVERGE